MLLLCLGWSHECLRNALYVTACARDERAAEHKKHNREAVHPPSPGEMKCLRHLFPRRGVLRYVSIASLRRGCVMHVCALCVVGVRVLLDYITRIKHFNLTLQSEYILRVSMHAVGCLLWLVNVGSGQ